jgi:hypothetical protein
MDIEGHTLSVPKSEIRDLSLRKLSRIGALDDNWDDAGAGQVRVAVVVAALKDLDWRIRDEDLPDSITPVPDGSIIFAWSEPFRKLTFEPDGDHVRATMQVAS